MINEHRDIGLAKIFGQVREVQQHLIQKEEKENTSTMKTTMKKIVKKAAKFESKKSLDGAMKFLKGNASIPVKKKK
jgi:hypothetical protein